MKKQTFKLTPKQKGQLDALGKKHRLDFVILHGSRATGKIVSLHPDVDLAIYRRGGIPPDEYLTLVNEFMGVFGDEVDVKTLHRKEPLFLYLAMQDSILLFGDPYFYHQFKAYAFHRYIDAASLFQLQEVLLKKGLERLKKEFKIYA